MKATELIKALQDMLDLVKDEMDDIEVHGSENIGDGHKITDVQMEEYSELGMHITVYH